MVALERSSSQRIQIPKIQRSSKQTPQIQFTSTIETGSTDTADTTDTEPEIVPITCDIGWAFTTPIEYEFFRTGDTVDATVQVDAIEDYTGYSIQWENRGGEIIGSSAIDSNGVATYSGTDFSSVKGLIIYLG